MTRPLTSNIQADGGWLELEAYQRAGGYQALGKALALGAKGVQELVKHAGLRGRGGAGFPTGQKWSFVPMGDSAAHPKYLVVNADEMEPGAFKDRLLLEGDPHQLLEGAIISALAIDASEAYIFLRQEYTLAAQRIGAAITQAKTAGLLGRGILGSHFSCNMHLHTSAGRYMCGEETGLLNALEGKRPTPRAKPPFPQASGLFGKPTVVNNVETVCCVKHIVDKGPDWFRKLSLFDGGGTKIYGVSGRVKRPGLWELPMGTPLREILFDRAGGMQDGYRFRGLLPGGASTAFLTQEHLDVRMDFDSVAKCGSRMGTGTIIVLDDKTCPVGMVLSLITFFARESCGWCTPCREGLPWAGKILRALEDGSGQEGDIEMLSELSRNLSSGNTFCSLAPGAVEPLQSAIKYFREDFERHIAEQRCPWRR